MTNQFTVALHGDSEAACVDILNSFLPLTAQFPSVTISTSYVGYDKGKQWVMVARKGGNSSPWMAVDKPRIDFNIHADNRADAHDIAQLVLQGMLLAQSNYVGKGVRLHVVRVETGIARSPDPDNETNRYVMSLRLTVTPE